MSTGLGEVHSTFWTRWYARLTQSDAERTQINQNILSAAFRCLNSYPIQNAGIFLLTVKEGDGVCADGVQGHRLFAVFGAAALVFLFPPEERPAGRCRESLTGVFLHFCYAVSAVKLLVHPARHARTYTDENTFFFMHWAILRFWDFASITYFLSH